MVLRYRIFNYSINILRTICYVDAKPFEHMRQIDNNHIQLYKKVVIQKYGYRMSIQNTQTGKFIPNDRPSYDASYFFIIWKN